MTAIEDNRDAHVGRPALLRLREPDDRTKVTRTALQNAASIAGLLLTTEALIVEKKEEKGGAPAMPGGGGMGGMY